MPVLVRTAKGSLRLIPFEMEFRRTFPVSIHKSMSLDIFIIKLLGHCKGGKFTELFLNSGF